jgi:hypothetical protein
MQSITLGDVTVTRITEWEGCAPVTAQLASAARSSHPPLVVEGLLTFDFDEIYEI